MSHPSGSGSGAQQPLSLDDLVFSVVPSARPRRGDSERRARERAELRADMVGLAEEILESQVGRHQMTSEAAVTEAVKRKLTKYAVDGGHGTSVRYDNLVNRLKAQPSAPRRIPAILQALEELAFTSTPAGATSAASRAANGRLVSGSSAASASSATPASRTPLLGIPNLRQTASDVRSEAGRSRDPSGASARGAPSPVEAAPSSRTPAQAPEPVVPQPPVPKAVLAQQWRARMKRPQVSEQELLRDAIFLLQGIAGKHVGFEEVRLPASQEPGADPEPESILRVRFESESAKAIDPPTRALIHRIAELGRLYRRISEFAQDRSTAEGSGLIMQSLCHFISTELTDYYRLIAILEAHLNQGPPTIADMEAGSEPAGLDPKGAAQGLTLKRIAVWTEDMALRMRLLSTIIESCKDAHGGALVSLIHSYTFNGDPFIRSFTTQLLDEVSKPFFHSLTRWIYEGELQDPFKEFFVDAHPEAIARVQRSGAYEDDLAEELGDADAVSLWQDKFSFRDEMLPSFLAESFGRKIFSTGKSLNFIRYSCGDSDWVATRSKLSGSGRDLRYSDLAGLEQTIEGAYNVASTRLLDIFLHKFKLLEHLRALKDYLMLARGDFVDRLMESLGPSLNRPASSLFRHNLTASLETAVRGSNAQYDDPDILRRLDARVLEFAAGDNGWDTFTLEYKVDSPVNAVLDAQAMVGYQTIFAHLWKIKRVELALGASWQRLISCTNILRRSVAKDPSGMALFRRGSHVLGLLGEMVHFVRQLQGFCQLEVIDYSWHDLQTFFAKRQGDLDELISSHRAYLNALIGKVLLRGGGRKGSVDVLAHELRANLDTMLAFSTAVDELAHHMTSELARRDLDVALPSSRNKVDNLEAIAARLEGNSTAFRDRTLNIIARLTKHSNLVVRDLGTRLNFNGTYQPEKASAVGGGGGGGGAGNEKTPLRERERSAGGAGGAGMATGTQSRASSRGANPARQTALPQGAAELGTAA